MTGSTDTAAEKTETESATTLLDAMAVKEDIANVMFASAIGIGTDTGLEARGEVLVLVPLGDGGTPPIRWPHRVLAGGCADAGHQVVRRRNRRWLAAVSPSSAVCQCVGDAHPSGK